MSRGDFWGTFLQPADEMFHQCPRPSGSGCVKQVFPKQGAVKEEVEPVELHSDFY